MWKTPLACLEKFCSIEMQLPLFELKLKTFTLLYDLQESGEKNDEVLF